MGGEHRSAVIDRLQTSGRPELYVVGPAEWVRRPAPVLDFNVLGPLEVCDGDRALHLGPPKQRAVLAVLLLEAGRVVSTDALVDRLWGEAPPARAVGALQAYVHNLRRILEPGRPARARPSMLASKACGYVLNVDPEHHDAVRFERLVREGEQLLEAGLPAGACAVLSRALDMWRGPALADVAYEPFAQAEIARLSELHAVALEGRVGADLALGNHVVVLAELEALAARYPSRECLRAAQMIALYRSGRQADALRAYRQHRDALVADLGIEPSPALRALERSILNQDPALEWHEALASQPIRPLMLGRATAAS